jgi:lipopolysaccharide assembly outer membrane protein LptD (OstA)
MSRIGSPRELSLSVLTASLVFCPAALGQEIPEHPGEKYSITARTVEVRTTEEGRVSYFKGGVRINHGSAVITADFGKAVEARDMALLEGNVRIVDGETEIRASSGEYYRREKKAHLFGDVDIRDGKQWVEADEVVYYRDRRMAVGTGSVSFKDLTNEITIEGGRGEYDFQEGHGSMSEGPILTAPGEKKILVTGQKMEIYRKEGKALAVGDVKVYQGEWTAGCDSLVYMSREEVAYLMGSPRIVEAANEATADKLKLEFENRKLCRAILSPNAEASYDVGEGEKNIVSGAEIVIDFEEGKAKRISVNGSASGTYYLKPKGE